MKLKKLIVKRRAINNHLTISNNLAPRNLRNPKRKKPKSLSKMQRVKWLK